MQDNLKFTITISVILLFVGITLISYNFVNTKRDEVFSYVNLSFSENKEDNLGINIDEDLDETTSESSSEESSENSDEVEVVYDSEQTFEYYLARLEIPDIGFNRGFYDKSSGLNNLRNNIKMLSESDYPSDDNGNVILAGHSGNYYNSYFGNLWKLELGDLAYIYYQNTKYTYKIVNIYTEDKDGVVGVKRDRNKSTLTLITCTKDSNTLQTIYILEKV